MAKFLDELDLRMNRDGRRFKLLSQFRYITDINPASFGYSDEKLEIDPETNAKRLIIIPAGFVTDFASVPKALWNIAPPIGFHSYGALIHDWLYTNHPEGRPWADRVFLEAMELNETPYIIKKLYPIMVRTFGQIAWDTDNGPLNANNWDEKIY